MYASGKRLERKTDTRGGGGGIRISARNYGVAINNMDVLSQHNFYTSFSLSPPQIPLSVSLNFNKRLRSC